MTRSEILPFIAWSFGRISKHWAKTTEGFSEAFEEMPWFMTFITLVAIIPVSSLTLFLLLLLIFGEEAATYLSFVAWTFAGIQVLLSAKMILGVQVKRFRQERDDIFETLRGDYD